MATAVTSNKIASNFSIIPYDDDPGATTATVVTDGTTARWVSMVNWGNFAGIVFPTIVGGGGVTLVEIVAATDSSGTNVTAVLSSGTVAADAALVDYVFIECTAEQIKEVGVAAGYNFTHVALRVTNATNTDENVAVYIRANPRFPQSGLTATTIS